MPRRLQCVLTLTTFALAAASTVAETIIVTSSSGGTGGPDCTLRDAITAANTDAPSGGCPAGDGADTLELPADATIVLTEVGGESLGPNGLPNITLNSEITVSGNGATIHRDSGAPVFRILQVSMGGILTLNELTLSNGNTQGDFPENVAGGIWNNGTLTLIDCTVTGNTAFAGGGILSSPPPNAGMLTLIDSTVIGNTAADRGGGIYNDQGTLTLTNCTVSGNTATAGNGGGIWSDDTATMSNCTVSGNTAGFVGGGIMFIAGTLTLTNSTISSNTALWAGGIDIHDIYNGSAILTDTTVCGNEIIQIDGEFTDGGGNVIADECPPCDSADLNSDGTVDAFDLAILLGSWGPCPDLPEPCPADLFGNGDGFVSADDLAVLLGNWGPCE